MSVSLLNEIIDKSPFENKITEVVSGGARGIDTLGELWAKWKCLSCYHPLPFHENGRCSFCVGEGNKINRLCKNIRQIPIKRFLPDYLNNPKFLAPKIRNQEMGDYAEGLVAVWDGESGGTRNMIEIMGLLGKSAWVWMAGKNVQDFDLMRKFPNVVQAFSVK